ncbi:MAG: hypothetical protein KA715_01405 [Xanthomonadaceae bacterium]|nr:hypothetical protein [Xanthomonadaceae bacterium]
MRWSSSTVLILFLLVSTTLLVESCGVKTAPTPIIRSKNELLDYAVQVEPAPTPTPSARARK